MSTVELAIAGHPVALREVWNRLEGTALPKVEPDRYGLPVIEVVWVKPDGEGDPTESLPVPSSTADGRTNGHT